MICYVVSILQARLMHSLASLPSEESYVCTCTTISVKTNAADLQSFLSSKVIPRKAYRLYLPLPAISLLS